MLVLPGMVDLHGDAFERQVMPRPGVAFDMDVALAETDRQLVANGITTAFHAVTFSFEPGLRGGDAVRDFMAAMSRLRGRLACDTRVHLRHEAYNIDAVDEILGWIADGAVDLLAFNDHTPPLVEKARTGKSRMRFVERTGLDPAAFAALL
ncbi:MAG: alpha-D-ribose 1-methylphosphonate 5-triphosphate diphosphatase, partial [Alphaproteobacteria bacterium]